jgi:riboflavin biosynthesis pyrimidine reductase
VITSRNGIVTWTRRRAHDDPIRAIAGGDFTRLGRRADVRLTRRFRADADAVSLGAQTLRDQPELIGAVDDIGGELGEALIRFRAEQGRPRIPLQVVYSESGRLNLDVPPFNTPAL